MTETMTVLTELERFARAMTAALTSVFDRPDAYSILAVVEAALPVGTRAEIGKLLILSRELRLPPADVRRQLLQRASTTLDRVLAADAVTFARCTATARASRLTLKVLAERLRAAGAR